MKILLTGATGFVGRNLLKRLPQIHFVTCLSRSTSPSSGTSVQQTIIADLVNLLDISRLPREIDAIIHLAQGDLPYPESVMKELFMVNVISTHSLASYAKDAGASHFIYASTGSIYSKSELPLKEDDDIDIKDQYPLTKFLSESMLKCYSQFFNIIILRLFAPYGPGQTQRMIPRIVDAVNDGMEVTIVNDGQPLINPIYIDDLVSIIIQSLSSSESRLLNVAGPEVMSVGDIAEIAGRVLGKAPIFREEKRRERWNLIADTTRMESLYTLDQWVDPKSGIQEMIMGESQL